MTNMAFLNHVIQCVCMCLSGLVKLENVLLCYINSLLSAMMMK